MTLTEERPADEFVNPRRWTVDEYYQIADAGLFDDERVELLDGDVWRQPPQTPSHVYCVCAAAEGLKTAFGPGFDARQKGPFTIDSFTESEPDVLVVPGSHREYAQHNPTPADARLLVEVADAGLVKDRVIKQNAYARAGIADYWIINLVNRQLEVYRDPTPTTTGHGYKTVLTLLDGDSVAPLSAPNSPVAVADLFPPLTTP